MDLRELLRRAAPYALNDLEPQLKPARASLRRASDARRALPPGSSRKRVTSANARYMRAAEHVDRLEKFMREIERAARGGA